MGASTWSEGMYEPHLRRRATNCRHCGFVLEGPNTGVCGACWTAERAQAAARASTKTPATIIFMDDDPKKVAAFAKAKKVEPPPPPKKSVWEWLRKPAL